MRKNKCLQWVASLFLAAMLTPAGVATAQEALLEDFEGGTNQNRFEDYWYFYNDAANNGSSQVHSARVSGSELIFTGEYGPGYGGSQYAGLLDYTFGSAVGMDEYVDPFVGMGTNLTADGSTRDLTGATKITFYAKASAPMAVRFKFELSTVTDYNHYQTTVNVTSQWTQFSVDLNTGLMGVAQESWGLDVPFELTKATKIAWEIKSEGTNPASGELWIDDVVIHGYTFVSRYECPSCMGAPGTPPAGAALSAFSSTAPTRNALRYFWYCYNDAGTRAVSDQSDYSSIFGGVSENTADATKPILVIDGNGQNGENAAFIEFELGPTFVQNAETIRPFVGLGTMTSDNLGVTFFDAASAGATGIYFEYRTSASLDFITLEVSDGQERGNEGLVHFVRLPGTGGEWRSANIPFSEFKLPDWDEVRTLLPSLQALNTSRIAKFQWKYQGNPDDQGFFAIENVIMAGQTDWESGVISLARQHGLRSGLSVAQVGGMLHVSLASAAAFESGRVLLVDGAGRVVALHRLTGDGAVIGTDGLVAGRYFLRASVVSHGKASSYGATVVVAR